MTSPLPIAETFPGADAAAWPAKWATAASAGDSTIAQVENAGRMAHAAGRSAAFAVASLESMPATGNGDVTADITLVAPGAGSGAVLQLWTCTAAGAVATSVTQGYGVSIVVGASATWQLAYGTGSSNATIAALVSTPTTWPAGATRRVRVQNLGTSIRAKMWNPVDPEPAEWQLTGSAPTAQAAGQVRLLTYSYSGGTDARWDNITVQAISDPLVRGVVGASTGSGSSDRLIVTMPAAAQAGDVAYLVSTTASSIAATAPDGYTQRAFRGSTSAGNTTRLWSKTLTAADLGKSVTVWTVGSTHISTLLLLVVANVLEVPETVDGVTSTVAATSIASASGNITPATPRGGLLLVAYAARNSASPGPGIGVPSSLVSAVVASTSTSATNLQARGAYRLVSDQTAQTPATATVTNNGVPVGMSLMLAPSQAGGAVALTGTGELDLAASFGRNEGAVAARGTGVLELWRSPDVPTINPANAPHLAVEVRADINEHAFTLGRSVLDGDHYLDYGPDDGGGWSNIVCDVLELRTRRGYSADRPLAHPETGAIDLTLVDLAYRFDPAIELPVVTHGTPIRVRAWGSAPVWVEVDGEPEQQLVYWSEVLATGEVDTVDVAYSPAPDAPPVVTIAALDLLGDLAQYEQEALAAPGIGFADSLRDRAQRALEHAGKGGRLSPESDEVFAVALPPATLGGNAWSWVTAASDAEQGRVWVDRRNRLVVRGRDGELLGPLRGTFSDSHEELLAGAVHCCYRDPAVHMTPQTLINAVRASRRVWEEGASAAAAVRFDDLDSQGQYGPRTLTAGSLELLDDLRVREWSDRMVTDHAQPTVRVESLSPAADAHPEAWPALCATDIGDRWAFRMMWRPQQPLDRILGVLGVTHEITPAGWRVLLVTTDAPEIGPDNRDGWFTLSASNLDDESEVLPPFLDGPESWVVGNLDGGGPDTDEQTGAGVDGCAPFEVWNAPDVDGGAP